MTDNEEKALGRWVSELTRNGFPPRHGTIREMAEEIRNTRVTKVNDSSIQLVQYPPIGKEWVSRFLQRHPHLKADYSRRIDASRIKESSPEIIKKWLATVVEILREHNINPEDVYNMDETGFAIGSFQAGRVIIDSRIRSQFQAQPGRQEWVTVIECICGDGSVIAPMVIFKGKNLSSEWIIPADIRDVWHFSCSPNGWTSNIHGIAWLKKVFEPATREKANGGYRVLILDGHGSHVTGEFIAHCMRNKIILLRLPPHTSHLLQPLDVGLFGPLKKALSATLDPLIRTQVARLHKSEWLQAFVIARQSAFKMENVLGGWRGAGLFPYNPKKVLRHLEPEPMDLISASESPNTPPNSTLLLRTALVTSSPPTAECLHQSNLALSTLINQNPTLPSPAQSYVKRLMRKSEQLCTEVSIIKKQLHDANEVLSARKKRKTGRHIALKDQLVLTTEEINKTLQALDEEEKKPKKRKQTQKKKVELPESETESEDEQINENNSTILPVDILDCIVVADR